MLEVERSAVPVAGGTYEAPVVVDRLPRRLGAASAAILTVGIIIGSGIFRVPGTALAYTGSAPAVLLVWIAGGVLALCGALSIAELAAMYPRAGGVYVYLREAYGPLIAFLAGWVSLFTYPAAMGALALVFAEYLGTLVPLGARGTRLVAAALILALALAGYRSVRWASALINTATVAKVAALLALVLALFLLGHGGGALATAHQDAPRWSGFGIALVTVLWAYNGWQDPALVVGEVRDPGHTFPRALLAGVGIVVAVYLIVNVAYLYVLPTATMASSPLVAAEAMRRVLGAAGASGVGALVMLSTFGALCAVVLATPRIFFAMAEDGLFFRRIAAVHPRYHTPHVAVAFTAILASLFTLFRSFEQLAELFVVGAWPFLALGVAAVLVLRRHRPHVPRPYRTPLYPAVPILFLVASLGVIGSALLEHPRPTLLGFAVTIMGVPVYFAWRRYTRRA